MLENEEEENGNSYRHLAVAPTRGEEVELDLNGPLWSFWERDGGVWNERMQRQSWILLLLSSCIAKQGLILPAGRWTNQAFSS